MSLLNLIDRKKKSAVSEPAAATASRASRPARYLQPKYRIHEFDSGYAVEVDVPGVSKRDVDISVESGTLELTARRSAGALEGWRSLSAYREEDVAYRLSLVLGEAIALDGIRASVADGVLRIDFPKEEEKRPRKIAIS